MGDPEHFKIDFDPTRLLSGTRTVICAKCFDNHSIYEQPHSMIGLWAMELHYRRKHDVRSVHDMWTITIEDRET